MIFSILELKFMLSLLEKQLKEVKDIDQEALMLQKIYKEIRNRIEYLEGAVKNFYIDIHEN